MAAEKLLLFEGIEMVARQSGGVVAEVPGEVEVWRRVRVTPGVELHLRGDLPKLKPPLDRSGGGGMSVRRAEEFGRDGVFLCRNRPPVWGWEKGSGNLAGIRELSSAFAEAPEAA